MARRWALGLREVSGAPVAAACAAPKARAAGAAGTGKRAAFKGRTARTLESDSRGLPPSPAAYSLVTLGGSPLFLPSLSFVIREVGVIAEPASRGCPEHRIR